MLVPASAPSQKTAPAHFQRAHHYATLLFAELGLILLYPFFIGLGFHDELFRFLAIIVFAAALYAVLGRGRITVIAFLLGVPAIAIHFVDIILHAAHLELAAMILGLVFLLFVTSVMIATIVSDPSVTTDTLAGAVSAYLLVGITFGVAYTLIEHLMPGSFKDTIQPGKQFSQSEFTFFSFVTLTTVGYGDIVPWEAHARAVAIIESVIGIMYPAVLISRLVGLHGRRRDEE